MNNMAQSPLAAISEATFENCNFCQCFYSELFTLHALLTQFNAVKWGWFFLSSTFIRALITSPFSPILHLSPVTSALLTSNFSLSSLCSSFPKGASSTDFLSILRISCCFHYLSIFLPSTSVPCPYWYAAALWFSAASHLLCNLWLSLLLHWFTASLFCPFVYSFPFFPLHDWV